MVQHFISVQVVGLFVTYFEHSYDFNLEIIKVFFLVAHIIFDVLLHSATSHLTIHSAWSFIKEYNKAFMVNQDLNRN